MNAISSDQVARFVETANQTFRFVYSTSDETKICYLNILMNVHVDSWNG